MSSKQSKHAITHGCHINLYLCRHKLALKEYHKSNLQQYPLVQSLPDSALQVFALLPLIYT